MPYRNYTNEEWSDYIIQQFSWVRSDLMTVRDQYDNYYGKVPFSEYVPVINFFMRRTKIDLDLVHSKSKGRSIVITVKSPKDEDYNPVSMEISRDKISYYETVSTEMTPEQIDAKRASDWNKYCKNHGFAKEDLGREFMLGPKKFKIVGCKSRKQTYGIKCYSYEKDAVVGVRTSAVAAALKIGIKKGDQQ